MNKTCPNQNCLCPSSIIRDGTFFRKDDSKRIQRFRCKTCKKRFSSATFSDAYKQKKRRLNAPLLRLLSSGVSLRRSALLLQVRLHTVERKLVFLGKRCRRRNMKQLKRFSGQIHNIQIDDLITKENSKLKPLTVSIGVCSDRRLILGAEVAQIPSFGTLSKIALKKYGQRDDQHEEALERLFEKLKFLVAPEVEVKSDEHQRYPKFVKKYFPKGKHLVFKSERACIAGQGELKKVRFDPLFMVNHTCALLRANINRLIRKTWCTTKKPSRLQDHLDIFLCFFNELLIKKGLTPI